MSSSNLVKSNDPNVEPVIPDEAAKTQRVVSLINQVQDKNFSHHRHGFRGTHVKTQGIVKGVLSVLPGLPPHLAQGLFGHGAKEHPIAIRYANEPSFLQDDRAPGPRGCGMKVFAVEGDFLDPVGEQTHTQDFTFNNAPLLELQDVTKTAEIFDIRVRNFDDGDGLKKELEKRDDKDLQFAPAGLPNQHFLSYTMYSQSAYRYGDYIVKYALFPTGEQQEGLDQIKIDQGSDPEQHSRWVRQYFQDHEAKYDFRVQLCRDIVKQPVENTSVPWDEEEFPFETVATVVIPKQDSFTAERRTFWEDGIKLNVWYGLQAHRPLGSVNRLRKAVYKASVEKRQEVNATKVQAISKIDEIP